MIFLYIFIKYIYKYNIKKGILWFIRQKLRRILRNAIDVGEKIFKKPGIVTELAWTVADNLSAVYPELHNNLKQVK